MDALDYVVFAPFSFQSKINLVPLWLGHLFIHGNIKLIGRRETICGLLLFFVLPVDALGVHSNRQRPPGGDTFSLYLNLPGGVENVALLFGLFIIFILNIMTHIFYPCFCSLNYLSYLCCRN